MFICCKSYCIYHISCRVEIKFDFVAPNNSTGHRPPGMTDTITIVNYHK